MDFLEVLFGVFLAAVFVGSPIVILLAVIGLVTRGQRLRAVEAAHESLEKRVLELLSRVRQLEGSPASASPAPAPFDEGAVSRLRDVIRAPVETALGTGAARAESHHPAAPIARATSAPLPPDASRAAAPRAPAPPIAPPRGAGTPPPSPPSGPRASGAPPSDGPGIERIVGVLLTAGVGAIALALAGLLFFHYAVKSGWIGPELRVILATVAGIAAVAGSVFLERRTPAAANALSAGGVVVLHAAFWASHVRYHLVPMELAFVLMALVTAVTVLLADRRKSPLTAVLGLLGGFATPMLLTSGSNRPIELFGYVLLLDAAFLWVASRRRWAFLAGLALAGSLVLQALWFGTRMEPAQLTLALGITGLFAAVFAATGALADEKDRWQWGIAQGAGVLAPFAFAIFFASQRGLGDDLVPHAILLAFLSAAASWLGRRWKNPLLGLGAAAGSIAVLSAFAISQRGATPGWEMVAVACGLAAIFHLFSEADSEAPTCTLMPAAFAAAGFAFVLSLAGTATPFEDPWPWIAGLAALSALLLRQARTPSSAALSLLPAVGFPLGLAMLYVAHHRHAGFPPLAVVLVTGALAAAGLQLVAFVRRFPETRSFTEHASALIAVTWLLAQPVLIELGGGVTPAWHVSALALAIAFLAILAATRLESGAWFAATVVSLALVHALARAGGAPEQTLLLLGAGAALATAWPFLVPSAFRESRAAWLASAFAGVLWFLPMRHHWVAAFGDRAIGALPLALAAVALAGAFGVRALFTDRALPIRRDLLAAFGAVALGFVALAVPLQLEKEWITVAWALEGVAVLWLWTRLDHAGLKWFGLALLGAVTVRLTLNAAVPQYHERAIPVLNWILYTYWVPVAALLASRMLLARDELGRLREWERPLYPPNVALGAGAATLGAIGVVFVWINLAIADWFSAGDAVLWSWQREPGRDVAMSIAWALYGLVLLGIGMARKSVALRWVSLAVLLLAIAKVFLYDLGELTDLYRVLSLLGLALSLILVSFGYQRFVFRRPLEGTS